VCGIAGIVMAARARAADASVVARMTATLVHRGPDDEGLWNDGPVALGVRRLSVIDVAGGHQPLSGETKRVWVAFNVEIYNHAAVRERLQESGHRFTTRSDTEVIAHAWEERGPACLDQLDGMFGLAVWDGRDGGTLHLARDRAGIKPLYYAVLPDQLVFGSELRALLAHPEVSRALDLRALSRYLLHEYVPAPDSILKAVRKLGAGRRLEYRDGVVTEHAYWRFAFRPAERGTVAAFGREVRDTLERAVRKELVSDVPLGVLLSGGIDSSAVAALAARHVGGPLRTFSIGFEDASFDESSHARRMAAVLGSEHHEAVFDTRAVLDGVASLPPLLDEPFADASLLPTAMLARFTRDSVTVALAGDGGDELFAGYPTYQAHRLASTYTRVPRAMRAGVIEAIIARLPVSLDDMSLDFKLKRFVSAIEAPAAERHLSWMGSFTPGAQRQVLTREVLAELEGFTPFAVPWDLEAAGALGAVEQALALDLFGYLGEGVLQKTDRASMAASLEVRVPMLDRHVIELAATIPTPMKLRGLTTKYVLKEALRGLVPDDILDRRKKGFGIPIARWLNGPLAPFADEMLAPERVRRRGLMRPEAVTRLLADHRAGRRDNRKPLYTLIAFEAWASRVLG
jgi:asparagine synthase (glutamine-hydrolysing)